MTGVSAEALEPAESLVALHRPGHSPDQRFHTGTGIYALEPERIVCRNRLLAGHTSGFARPGDYCRFDAVPESAIVIRRDNGKLRTCADVVEGPLPTRGRRRQTASANV